MVFTTLTEGPTPMQSTKITQGLIDALRGHVSEMYVIGPDGKRYVADESLKKRVERITDRLNAIHRNQQIMDNRIGKLEDRVAGMAEDIEGGDHDLQVDLDRTNDDLDEVDTRVAKLETVAAERTAKELEEIRVRLAKLENPAVTINPDHVGQYVTINIKRDHKALNAAPVGNGDNAYAIEFHSLAKMDIFDRYKFIIQIGSPARLKGLITAGERYTSKTFLTPPTRENHTLALLRVQLAAIEREQKRGIFASEKTEPPSWAKSDPFVASLKPGDRVQMAMTSPFHPGATLVVIEANPMAELIKVALGAVEFWSAPCHIARKL